MIRRSLPFVATLTTLAAVCVEAGAPVIAAPSQPLTSRGSRCRVPASAALSRDQGQTTERVIPAGKSQVLQFRWITKVVIGNPSVADVVPVSDDELVLNGKAPGQTNLFVWDRTGRSEWQVVVTSAQPALAPDMPAVAAEVARDLANLPVRVNAIGDTLFLSGAVATPESKALAGAIAAAYPVKVQNFIQVAEAPKAIPSAAEVAATLNRIFGGSAVTARVIDDRTVALEGNVENKDSQEQMRKVAESVGAGVNVVCFFHPANPRMRQVLVRSRVLEVNRVLSRQLGVDWGSITKDGIAQPFVIGQRVLGGGLHQLNPIGAAINALEEHNAVRELAEPNLLVMEGNRGSVLIGGEIPVPIAQASGGGATVTVEYKPFGINLGVDVLGIDENGISLHVQPEVSTLDSASGVMVNGFSIPGLRTRRAESTVRIRPGESLAIGGLLENEVTKNTRAIPLLSKIPILGELFKSRSFQKGETELVILVTPELKEEK